MMLAGQKHAEISAGAGAVAGPGAGDLKRSKGDNFILLKISWGRYYPSPSGKMIYSEHNPLAGYTDVFFKKTTTPARVCYSVEDVQKVHSQIRLFGYGKDTIDITVNGKIDEKSIQKHYDNLAQFERFMSKYGLEKAIPTIEGGISLNITTKVVFNKPVFYRSHDQSSYVTELPGISVTCSSLSDIEHQYKEVNDSVSWVYEQRGMGDGAAQPHIHVSGNLGDKKIDVTFNSEVQFMTFLFDEGLLKVEQPDLRTQPEHEPEHEHELATLTPQ